MDMTTAAVPAAAPLTMSHTCLAPGITGTARGPVCQRSEHQVAVFKQARTQLRAASPDQACCAQSRPLLSACARLQPSSPPGGHTRPAPASGRR
jgi:hypothetical protein